MLAAAELSRAGNVSRAKTGGGARGFQARGLGLLWQSPQLFVANLGGGRQGRRLGARHGLHPGVPGTAAPLGGQGWVWPLQESTHQATCATLG